LAEQKKEAAIRRRIAASLCVGFQNERSDKQIKLNYNDNGKIQGMKSLEKAGEQMQKIGIAYGVCFCKKTCIIERYR